MREASGTEKMLTPPSPIVDVPIPQGTRKNQRLAFQYNNVVLSLHAPKDYREPDQRLRVEIPWESLLKDKNYNGKDRGIEKYDPVSQRWRLKLIPLNTRESAKQNEVLKQKLQCDRDELCAKAKSLNLPLSALDSMIASLGGKSNVAEMTGRRRRVCDGVVEIREGSQHNAQNLYEFRGLSNMMFRTSMTS